MKNFFKKFFVILAILVASTTTLTTPTYARKFGECLELLPGMISWDCNVRENPTNESGLKSNVRQIIINIAKDIVAISGYLAIGFVIYGGYLYIFSYGDPGKTAAGKKTLTRTFIGLAIIGLANIIISSIGIATMNNAGAFSDGKDCIYNTCTTAPDLINNTINWFISIAGAIALIFIVVGGIGYITAAGDPGKLQKSKNTIFYAFIGLVIVGLSSAISNFAINAINSSNAGKDIREPIVTLVNTVIGIAGLVAVVYVIKGGIDYMTSTGDVAKLKKAKSTILYACIGLIICALAFAITNWAVTTINDSTNDQSLLIDHPEKAIALLDKTL